MGFLKRFAAGFATGFGAVEYARWVTRRNAALERPPIRDLDGRPLPVHRFRYTDGEEVEFVDAGSGPTIVWVPGADGPKETFRYQLPHFARHHRVIAADLRETVTEEHDFDRFVDDLVELLEDRVSGPFVLVGQSLGSAITLRFAVLHPERLRGMVLMNPVARVSFEHLGPNRTSLIPVAQASTRYLPTGLSRLLARAVWSPLGLWIYDDSPGREALIEYSLATGPRTVPASVSAARVGLLEGIDLPRQLWSADVPALVVKGPRDVYCPVTWALEIADRLPESRYVPVPGTGHCSHISRPGLVNQIIESWLKELPPAPDGEDR